MITGKLANCFQLNDDLAETDEIRLVCIRKNSSFVHNFKNSLPFKWYAGVSEFDCQRFLVNWFQKTASQGIVNLKASPNDFVAFVFVEEVKPIIQNQPASVHKIRVTSLHSVLTARTNILAIHTAAESLPEKIRCLSGFPSMDLSS